MDLNVLIDKNGITIPNDLQNKWQNLLNILVELIDIPAAIITKIEAKHIGILLCGESVRSHNKLNINKYLVETCCKPIMNTGYELMVANASKDARWKTRGVVKTGIISFFGIPLVWPDDDIFGILCLMDTKENYYTGTSKILMTQCKESIETQLALLFKTHQLESLLESFGDIKERYYPDISSDAVITTNSQDQITSWNPGATSMFGYVSTEIMGKPFSHLIADPFRKVYNDMRQFISEDSSGDSRKVIEVVGIRKDGIELPIVLTYTRFKRGDELLFTASIRMITKRKRFGEIIQFRNRELNVLNKLVQSLNQSLKLDDVLLLGLDNMINAMDLTAGAIYLSDQVTGELSLAAEKGITIDLEKAIVDLPIGKQFNLGYDQFAFTLPLVSRDINIGLTVFVRENEFRDDQVQLIQAATSYLAAAIDNAYLFEKTESLSFTDELTGLYNRRHFHSVLKAEIDRLLRYPGKLSLVILDLDGFKEFNDRYGHVEGDNLLKCFAHTMEELLRKTDYAFRFGGDEFVVILPLTTARSAETIINRFRKKWREVFARLQGRNKSQIDFSVGIAEFPQDTENPDTLIRLADAALYESKRQGKNKSTLVSDM